MPTYVRLVDQTIRYTTPRIIPSFYRGERKKKKRYSDRTVLFVSTLRYFPRFFTLHKALEGLLSASAKDLIRVKLGLKKTHIFFKKSQSPRWESLCETSSSLWLGLRIVSARSQLQEMVWKHEIIYKRCFSFCSKEDLMTIKHPISFSIELGNATGLLTSKRRVGLIDGRKSWDSCIRNIIKIG